MQKSKLQLNRCGQSIIEIIVAVGIFTLIASSIVILYLGSHSTNLRDTERLQADMYLQQGMEATRSIRDYNFSNLTNGTHGLTDINTYWEFSGSSNTFGQFTRSITVADVQRNSSCVIVDSGGTIDNNSKKVTVTVTWDLEGGNSTSISTMEYLNKWTDQTGCCESSYLSIDLSQTIMASGNKRVTGITIENLGSSDITIDKITPTWTNSHLLEEIKIDNTSMWKHNGAGSPSGRQASGTEINIADFTLSSGSGAINIDWFDFDGDMSETSFTFLFTMSDSTARYVEVTPGAAVIGQGDYLVVDTSNVTLSGGDLIVSDITIENIGGSGITIDTITVSWTGGGLGNQIQEVVIDSDSKWFGNASSEIELDITDFTLVSEAGTYNIDFGFKKSMAGSNISIIFGMVDASTVTVLNIQP